MVDQLKSNKGGKHKKMPWEEKPMHLEDYLLRNNKKMIWFWILIYIFTFFVPECYGYFSKIPPLEELQLARGTFSYKPNNHGRLIILNNNKKVYYTCRDPGSGNHDCIWDAKNTKNRLDSLVGKTANIWWFEQKTYFFSSQRRLMRLVVDGYEEYSYEEAVRKIKRAKNDVPYSLITTLFLFIGILLFVERFVERRIKRQIDEESKHGDRS